MDKKSFDIILCENCAVGFKRLSNGVLLLNYENKDLLNKDLKFYNKVFNKFIYSIFEDDNKLMIVNC